MARLWVPAPHTRWREFSERKLMGPKPASLHDAQTTPRNGFAAAWTVFVNAVPGAIARRTAAVARPGIVTNAGCFTQETI